MGGRRTLASRTVVRAQTFLIYRLSEPDPAWDGSYANVIDPTSDAEQPLAIGRKPHVKDDQVVTVQGQPLFARGGIPYLDFRFFRRGTGKRSAVG